MDIAQTQDVNLTSTSCSTTYPRCEFGNWARQKDMNLGNDVNLDFMTYPRCEFGPCVNTRCEFDNWLGQKM